MALGDIFQGIVNSILSELKTILGPFGKMFDLLSHFWERSKDFLTKGNKLFQSVLDEIKAWKHFKESISYRTQVINIPKAVEKTQELLQQIFAAWRAIIDLFKELKGKITEGGGSDPTEEAKAAVEDIEQSGFKSILKQFPKLARGLEKVLGFVALAADALGSIIQAIDDLQAIVDATKAIREEVETGGTIFLQQKNKRKTVKLETGKSIRIRIGRLHS
jgi:hypothetical protein